jgi:inhibitor of Bruton tyrosine kinase
MLRRPEHLFQRFHEEFQSSHRTGQKLNAEESSMPQILVAKEPQPIPFFIRSKPTIIHDVQMAKFSTAVLTTDTVSNLYICGYGSGGRLGLGDERTRFQFTCIEGGVLAQKEIVSVALGHHHTMALSRNGDVFTWGSNVFGQLGYSLPATSKKEEPLQLVPRQIFGPLKRELVCGIAASGIHSAVYTATSLYTFGKNEGQLGIVDADARSLQIQIIPRKVGSSLFLCTDPVCFCH